MKPREILGLIPARAGSKGIPGKNSRELAGKPLIEYAIDAAQASSVIDRTVVSTDSEEIAQLARKLGAEAPFLRPAELAGDTSGMYGVVRHALDALEASGWIPDAVALLQPTSPLRRPEHLRRAVEILDATGSSSVVSVVEIPSHFSPQYAMRIRDDLLVNFLPVGMAITRRQDVEPAFSRDGTVYLSRREVILHGDLYGSRCAPLVLPFEESINLDTPTDWARAEAALS